MLKYGQIVRVNRKDHPLHGAQGFLYKVSTEKLTVLFDREVLYDFEENDLEQVVVK